jgi:hypothetical protein
MDGIHFTDAALEKSSVTERKSLSLQIFGNDLRVEIKAYSFNQYSKNQQRNLNIPNLTS